jgi:hypothetical protein
MEKSGLTKRRKSHTGANLQAREIQITSLGMRKIFLCIALISTLMACSQEISIEGFDAQKWKDDPNGCHGSREKYLFFLMSNQKELLGRSEMEIKNLLGKPDATDIRSRGQKFFEYGVKGGSLCDPKITEAPEILRIRFDALNRVSEVAIY